MKWEERNPLQVPLVANKGLILLCFARTLFSGKVKPKAYLKLLGNTPFLSMKESLLTLQSRLSSNEPKILKFSRIFIVLVTLNTGYSRPSQYRLLPNTERRYWEGRLYTDPF